MVYKWKGDPGVEFHCLSVSIFYYLARTRVVKVELTDSLKRYTQIWFTYRCMFPTWSDWDFKYTAKGYTKLLFSRAIKLLTFGAAVAALVRFRKGKKSVQDIARLLRAYVRQGILSGSNILQVAALKI